MLHGKAGQGDFLQLAVLQAFGYGNLIEESDATVLLQQSDDGVHIANLGIVPEIGNLHAVKG